MSIDQDRDIRPGVRLTSDPRTPGNRLSVDAFSGTVPGHNSILATQDALFASWTTKRSSGNISTRDRPTKSASSSIGGDRSAAQCQHRRQASRDMDASIKVRTVMQGRGAVIRWIARPPSAALPAAVGRLHLRHRFRVAAAAADLVAPAGSDAAAARFAAMVF